MIFKKITNCLILYFLFSANTANTALPLSTDYTIYALFTYNFVKYTKWPKDPKEVLIGVYRNDNATNFMEKMAKVKTSPSLSLSVINIREDDQAGKCQVLFFPNGNKEKTQQLIQKLGKSPILILSEDGELYQKGADIIFKVVSDRLRFVINVESLNSKNIQVSSSLLSLSDS